MLFNHQAQVADVQAIETRSGLHLAPVNLAKHSARFDLALDTHERAGQLHAAFTYATDVFDTATVEALGEQWLALVQALADEAGGAVGELPLPGLALPLARLRRLTQRCWFTSVLPRPPAATPNARR